MPWNASEEGATLSGMDPVDEALAGILARPEFTPRTPSPLERVLQWIREGVGDLLGWVLERLPRLDAVGDTLGGWAETLLYVALGIAVIGVGWFVARALARRSRRPGAHPASEAQAAPEALDPATWEARARGAAEAGRFREAALFRYRALLLRLAARDLLRLGEGRTPGEYHRELRRGGEMPQEGAGGAGGGGPVQGGQGPGGVAPGGVAGAFGGFLRHFHRVAFGSEPPERSGWEALALAAAEVEGRLPGAGLRTRDAGGRT